MPTDLDYLAPTTVDDAIALKAAPPGTACLLGGTDLLPQMRAGRKAPERLVDLKRIPELHEIREVADGGPRDRRRGAARRHRDPPGRPRPLPAPAPSARRRWAPGRCASGRRWPGTSATPPRRPTRPWRSWRSTRVGERRLGRRAPVDPDRRVLPRAGPDRARPGRARDGRSSCPAASAGFRGSYLRLSRRKGMDLATVGVLVGKSNGTLAGALARGARGRRADAAAACRRPRRSSRRRAAAAAGEAAEAARRRLPARSPTCAGARSTGARWWASSSAAASPSLG